MVPHQAAKRNTDSKIKNEPTELQLTRFYPTVAETTGFEPATFGLTGQYANRYTTPP
jgi:hypothetical protein